MPDGAGGPHGRTGEVWAQRALPEEMEGENGQREPEYTEIWRRKTLSTGI